MCGFCGIVDPAGVDVDRLLRMSTALRHRGPDDYGQRIDGPVGFAHRRLSIIDTEGGHQPLSNEDGSVWVVFNGAIYNYQALRDELEARGHRFATRTDTETIVHLYEELGERCVERMRGMFAFVIWDARARKLFLARDRLGQKPLFYAHQGDRFAFASEIKGLLAGGVADATLDPGALHGYLVLRFIPSPHTMFRGIRALPPAHTLTLDVETGEATIRRYWELGYRPKWEGSEEELTDRLEEVLTDAVRLHLVSDHTVGTFLSGGIDSSLMTALVSRIQGAGVPTFSIGTESADYNELPAARIVAERYGTDHHEEIVRPDLLTLLPEMVHHLDMPGDPIAACQYHVARLAARRVKVAIGGDGGDELLAGYDRMAGFGFIDLYARVPEALRRKVIGPLLGLFPDSFSYKNTVAKLRWMHSLSFYSGGERYAEATAHFRFTPEQLQELYTPDFAAKLRDVDPRRPIIDAFDAADADELLDRLLHADVTTRLPEHLLILFDRMTMAHSIEGRSPLLDHHVAEFAARLPTGLKLRGFRLKYLLRKLAERYLPTSITRAPKRGFMFPIAYWLKNELRFVIRRALIESRLVEEGLLRPEPIVRLLDEHQSGRVDHHHRLWMLLNLEIWYRMYMRGDGALDVAHWLGRIERENAVVHQ